MEVILTNRGAHCLVFRNFRYRVEKQGDISTTWRCVNKTCKARLTTDGATAEDKTPIIATTSQEEPKKKKPPTPTPSQVLKEGSIDHNHESTVKQVDTERVRTALKRKAGASIDSVGDIVCAEAEPFQSLSYDDIPKFAQIVKRIRSSQVGPLPGNKQGVFASLESYSILDKKLDIIVTDRQDKIVMLTAEVNLVHLATAPDVLGDGTFQFCEKHFYQLYVVHAYANEIYTPCIYFLLPDKTIHSYKAMLDLIVEISSFIGVSFIPLKFHVDLEQAAHIALQSRFPHCQIAACQFHLAQSWWRRIAKLGMTEAYTNADSPTGQWLKLLFGLPALPPDEVEPFFTMQLLSRKPDDTKLDDMISYITANYISQGCSFPPEMWAGHTEVTTTNACESFHQNLQHSFSCSHPDIWKVLRALEKEQTKTRLKIRATESLYVRPEQRDKRAQKDELREQYGSGTISQFEFVKKMSFKMLPPAL